MVEPQISVVIPCRNEAQTIDRLLDDLAKQDLGRPFTVVVADGLSDDGTWERLTERQSAAPDPYTLILVRNPDRTIPHGLNRAVEAAPAGVIIRVDAHGRIGSGFIRGIAEAIGDDESRLVGPRIEMIPDGDSAMAQTIALILNSTIGNGGTPSRIGTETIREVAHSVMSCWHRQVWARNRGFDESLLSNEDFDFDWRARINGCRVLSLPEPIYKLKARPGLISLARQRWRYGWWKGAVVRRHPRSLHARQTIPPLAILAVAPMAALAPIALAACACAWLGLVWVVALRSAARARIPVTTAAIALAPVVAAVVQFVWGGGMLAGLLANHPGRPQLPVRQSA